MAESEDIQPNSAKFLFRWQDGTAFRFHCKTTMPLGKLMIHFCERVGVPVRSMHKLRFLFDGKRINMSITPDQVRRREHATTYARGSCCSPIPRPR